MTFVSGRPPPHLYVVVISFLPLDEEREVLCEWVRSYAVRIEGCELFKIGHLHRVKDFPQCSKRLKVCSSIAVWELRRARAAHNMFFSILEGLR